MTTFLPLELTLIVSVPERVEVNVATLMSWPLTVVAECRLMLLSRVEPQWTLTVPHVEQVVARRAIRFATTPVRVSFDPLVYERSQVERYQAEPFPAAQLPERTSERSSSGRTVQVSAVQADT